MFKVGDIIQNDWSEGDRFCVVVLVIGDVRVVIGSVAVVLGRVVVPGGVAVHGGVVVRAVVSSDAIGTIVAIEEHDGRQFYKVFYHTGRYGYGGWQDFDNKKPTSGFFTVETTARMKFFS